MTNLTPKIKIARALSNLFNSEPVLKDLVDSIDNHAKKVKRAKRLARKAIEKHDKKERKKALMSRCIKQGSKSFNREYKSRNI